MKRKKRVWLFHLVGFILGIGILVVLIQQAGFERFFNIIRRGRPLWLAAAVFVYTLSWLFRTWRLERLVAHGGLLIKMTTLFKLYISSFSLNIILPAKLGDLAAMAYLKMHGLKIGRSAAVILQTRILDMLALIVLSMPALFFFFHVKESPPYWILVSIALALLAILVFFGLVIFDRKKVLFRLLEKLGHKWGNRFFLLVVEKLNDAYGAYHKIIKDGKLLRVSILFSLLIWLSDGLTCLAVSLSLGCRVPLSPVILAVSLGNIGKSIPVTPGGLGVYEGIVSAVLVLSGVNFHMAVAIAVADHLLKKILNLAVGIPVTAVLGMNVKEMIGMFGGKKNREGPVK